MRTRKGTPSRLGGLGRTGALAWLIAIGLLAGLAPAAGAAGGPQATAARIGSVSASQRLQLVFPLVADDAGLSRFATAVSTPGSPDYGHYVSIAWLSRRFGAPALAKARVARYLRSVGAARVRVDATGLFVDAVLPAGRAQALFSTTLARFHAARGGASYTAPAAPVRIPRALAGLVTGVVGLDTQPLATAPALTRATSGPPLARAAQATPDPSGYLCTPSTCLGTQTGCASGLAPGGFSPNEYLAAYGYAPLQSSGELGQGERVALIEIDGFRESDIEQFADCFGLRVPQIDGFGVGVSKALAPGPESTLDLEVLDSVAPDLKSIDVYESSPMAGSVLMALTAPLQNSGFKPEVISASLGLCESQTLAAVGHGAINATEAALEEAAASGISFLAASGDDGSEDCTGGINNTPLPDLAVNYPASSPWATGVGGTNIVLNASNAITNQVVWNDENVDFGAGGGGVSGLFPRPGYQTGTVTSSGRAVPDVAMLADIAPGYDVYCTAGQECAGPNGAWQTVGGTSAATPLLAGGLALVDEVLRKEKLQSLGLANPLLYTIGRNATEGPAVFDDVTIGSNDLGEAIDGTPNTCCTAAPGFDDATGWGSVNLEALSVAALAAQPKIVNVSLALPGGQRPVANHHVLARVTCTGACLFGAKTVITIGRGRPFTDYSNLYHLSRRGSRTIPVGYSKAQFTKLKAAVATHTRITATIYGAIVDAGGNIERESSPRKLTITQ